MSLNSFKLGTFKFQLRLRLEEPLCCSCCCVHKRTKMWLRVCFCASQREAPGSRSSLGPVCVEFIFPLHLKEWKSINVHSVTFQGSQIQSCGTGRTRDLWPGVCCFSVKFYFIHIPPVHSKSHLEVHLYCTMLERGRLFIAIIWKNIFSKS